MPTAEFEEKEYEIPLYVELADGSPYVWSPGQVLEKLLGLDGTQFTRNSTFWKVVGRNVPPGVSLNTIASSLSIARQLPTFRCNLMLQVKRPQFLVRRVGGYSGPSPYYRFKTWPAQQNVLENLFGKIHNRAYIGYASPAFYRLTHLYRNILHSRLVSHSNFISVNHLTGHSHWVFCNPGTSGKALSEPKEIQEEPLTDQLNRLASIDKSWKLQNDAKRSIDLGTEGLYKLAETIRAVCIEESEDENSFSGDVIEWMDDLESSWDDKTHQSIRYFSSIQLFCHAYDILWLVIG